MNADDLWAGAREATSNARNLFHSSEILANNKLYGPATSLAILAAEEAIKGMTYAYCSVSGIDEVRELELNKHVKKHELGLYYYALHYITARLVHFVSYLEDRRDLSVEEKTKEIEKFVNKYQSDFDQNKIREIALVNEWKKHSNKTKNDCLYVDTYKGHWRNPVNTSRKSYNRQKRICGYFVSTAESSILYSDIEKLRQFSKELFSKP